MAVDTVRRFFSSPKTMWSIVFRCKLLTFSCRTGHVCLKILKSQFLLVRVAQSVTCLTADMYLTADRGVASSIPARSQIVHEIISLTILLPTTDLKGLLSVTRKSFCTKYWLACPEKVCLPEIAVDCDVKHQTKQMNKNQTTIKFN